MTKKNHKLNISFDKDYDTESEFVLDLNKEQKRIDQGIAEKEEQKHEFEAGKRFNINDIVSNPLIRIIFRLSYLVLWIPLFVIRFLIISLKRLVSNYRGGMSEEKSEDTFKIKKRIYSSLEIPKSFKKVIKKRKQLNILDSLTMKNPFAFKIRLNKRKKNLAFKFKFKKRKKNKNEILNKRVEGYKKELFRKIDDIRENNQLSPRHKPWRKAVLFALFLFIIILPFKALSYFNILGLSDLKEEVMGKSRVAINNFMSASQSAANLDFSRSAFEFSKAGDNFTELKEELDNINNVIFSLASLSNNAEIKLASQTQDILASGIFASQLGTSLSLAMDSILEEDDKKTSEKLDDFIYYAKQSINDSKELNRHLDRIDISALPVEYRDKFISLREKSVLLETGLNEFISLSGLIKTFLGSEKDRRYLLIFQNNTEMRASGGFMGSYALIDVRQGEIKNLEVPKGGTYDTEAGLTILVKAPKPLQLVNPLWHFWDSNWWFDWEKSARNIMWFYEKSDGPTVDGVISFTPTFLESLLEIVGPIDMSEDYGVVVDHNNFWSIVQEIVENKDLVEEEIVNEDGEVVVQMVENTKPKTIIGDMMNKIMEEFPKKMNQTNLLKILGAVEKNLSEKQILLFFDDEGLQEEMENRNWAGKMRETDSDFLAIINTNIAGGKSDKKMREIIDHKIELRSDGSLITTLKIERRHTGIRNETFSGVRNVNWMRIYVPKGSILIEASGFETPDSSYFEEPESHWFDIPELENENNAAIHAPSGTKIYVEGDKTVFANWSMVDPGQSSYITLTYKLPFSLNAEKIYEEKSNIGKLKEIFTSNRIDPFKYSLLIQKQPGSLFSEINSTLKVSDDYEIVWSYPDDMNTVVNGWRNSTPLDTDKYWSVILEKN